MRSTPCASARSRCASLSRSPSPSPRHVRQHAEHVRPLRRPPVAPARHRPDEPDDRVARGTRRSECRRAWPRRAARTPGRSRCPAPQTASCTATTPRQSATVSRSRSSITGGLPARHQRSRGPAARPAIESPARHRRCRSRDRAAREQDAAHAGRRGRRRRRGSGCRRPSPPRRRHLHQLERRAEDARMRLHEAVLGRRHGDRDEPVELEVRLERREAAVRVGDQARAARRRPCSAVSVSATSS